MALTKEDLQEISQLMSEQFNPIIERLDRINEQLDKINKPLTGLMNDLIKLKKTPKLQNARLIPFFICTNVCRRNGFDKPFTPID